MYWRPRSEAAVNHIPAYQWEESHAEAAYTDLARANRRHGIEIYYRLGESWRGPTYTEAPLDVLDPRTQAREGGLGEVRYAAVAANILDYLLSIQILAEFPTGKLGDLQQRWLPSISPAFVEIWNEPDGSFFVLPEVSSYGPTALAFTDLAAALIDALDNTPTLSGLPSSRPEMDKRL